MTGGIAARLEDVRRRLAAACERAGRAPADVSLVAVTKTLPAAAVREAFEAGQRDFGENYAQELRDKANELQDLAGLRWHFIGPVQTNKVRYLVGRAVLVHAVDRLEAARALSERAERQGEGPVRCLLSVNVGGEETKSGVSPEALPALWAAVRELPALSVEGLFCLPPYTDDPEASRPAFRRLRELRDALRNNSTPDVLPHLSMGMSHDFEVAIEEGATLVRVGTAIFGERERRA